MSANTQTRAGTPTGPFSKIGCTWREVRGRPPRHHRHLRLRQRTVGEQSDQRRASAHDEEVIEKVYLRVDRRGTARFSTAYSYRFIVGGLGVADDMSGNIR